jgi:hypothetical protein
MNDDDLRQLLRKADAALNTAARLPGPPLSVTALETEIARRRSKRRTMAGIAMTAAMVAVVASAFWLGGDRRNSLARHARTTSNASSAPETRPTAIDAERLRAELAELEAEAELRMRVVADLRQAAAAERLQDELTRLEREVGPAAQLRAELAFQHEVDRSAIVNLTYAERLAEELGDTKAAAVEYRRVVTRFPNTPWALAATEALAAVNGAM